MKSATAKNRGAKCAAAARAWLALLLVFAAFALPALPVKAQTQTQTQTPATAAAVGPNSAKIARVIEERIRQNLVLYVPSSEFFVRVSATAKAGVTTNVPYWPKTGGNDFHTMSADQLSAAVDALKVSILLSSRYTQTSQEHLSAIIESAVHIDASRGDRINFGTLNLPSAAPQIDPAAEREAMRAAAAARAARARAEDMRKERDDLKRELDLAKTETGRIQREKMELEAKERTEQAAGSAAGPDGKPGNSPKESLFERVASHGVLAVGALLGLLALALAARSLGASVGASVNGVAGALQALSGAFATSKENSGNGKGESDAIAVVGAAGGHSSLSTSTVSLEAMHRRILELNQELLSSLTPETEQILLEHVSRLVASPDGMGKAVASLEIMNREKANALYLRLSTPDQQAVLKYMRSGGYGAKKAEFMMEAGEELKTRIIAGTFQRSGRDLSAEVGQRLLRLSDADLVDVSMALNAEVLPRLYLYLEPARISSIFDQLLAKDEQKFATSVTSLAKMPKVVAARHLDEPLLPVLDAQIRRMNDDEQRPYLQTYLEVIESAGDELGEHIMNGLVASSERLDAYLKANVINVTTFFRLAKEVREDVVSRMSNGDVAVFVVMTPEANKERILDAMSERRRGFVQEDVERAQGLPERQRDAAATRVKKTVVEFIKAVKGTNSLDSLLAANEKSPPAAAQSGTKSGLMPGAGRGAA